MRSPAIPRHTIIAASVIGTCVLLAVLFFSPKSETRFPQASRVARERAAAPVVQSTKVRGTLKINDAPAESEQRREFKKGTTITVAVDNVSIAGGFDRTAGVIQFSRVGDKGLIIGGGKAIMLPGPGFEVQVPKKVGEWDLRVLTASGELICQQPVSVVD